MRTHNFAKHLAVALSKPALENAGHVKAAFGGAFTTAAYGSKIENRMKELEALHAKIAHLKGQVRAGEGVKAAHEALGENPTLEATSGAWKGFKEGYGKGWWNGGIGTMLHAGKQHEALAALDKKIVEANAEIARLEGEVHGKVTASKEEFGQSFVDTYHIAVESFQAALSKPALEDGAEGEAVIAAPQSGTEVIEAAYEPIEIDSHLIAADDVGDQLEGVCDEAHGLHKATKSLESILLAVSQEANGIDSVSAKYVTLAVESITGEWDSPVALVPSVESFGGEISRKDATLTLESNVKEVIKQVIAYLKNLWDKFVLLLKKYYQHLTAGTGALEAKAKAIKAKAEKLTGAPSAAEIEIDGALAHRLAVGGKVESLDAILDLADKVLKHDFAMSKEAEENQIEAAVAIGKLFGSDESNFDENLAAVEKISAKAGSVPGGLFSENGGKSTPELPGGVSFEVKSAYPLMIAKNHHEGDVAPVKLPVLSKEAIIGLADKILSHVSEFKQAIDQINDAEKAAHASFEAIKDTVNINEAQAKKLGAAVSRQKLTVSNLIRTLVDVHIVLVKAESAVLSVADKAVASYAKPAAAPAGLPVPAAA